PNMRGTLVELRGPAQRARQQFEEEGLSARATVLTGSFFDTLPAGADIYWLSAIIHDWGDADAVAILHRCADAAGRTGRVLIAESLLDPTQDLAGRVRSTCSCWFAAEDANGPWRSTPHWASRPVYLCSA